MALLVDFDQTSARIAEQDIDAELLWDLHARVKQWNRAEPSLFCLAAAQLEWVVEKFRSRWPMTCSPVNEESGDRNPWDATRLMNEYIVQLAQDSSDQACEAMQRLSTATADGYTEYIKAMQFEQRQLRTERDYQPIKMATLQAIVNDAEPELMSDLQVLVLDELTLVQAKIKSDDTDSWRGFVNDHGVPYDEERCRDHLLGLLRQGNKAIQYEPETHGAQDKRVDISCAVGQFRLPVEIKGQWHPKL